MTPVWVELGKYFPPEMGGIERVSAACAHIAHENGFDVHVVSFTNSSSKDEAVPGVGLVSRRRAWLKPASAPLGPGYFLAALGALVNADVAHLHMPNPLAALAVWLWKGSYRLILHWHSDVVAQRRAYRFYRWLESALLRRADQVVVTTAAYADASEALRPWRWKCVEVALSADAPDLPTGKAALPKTLLACGRLVSYKGFDVLVRAMTFLPADYRLRICGTGPLLATLEEQVRASSVEDRVQLLGFVSDEELADLMAESDVFCMPSVTRAEAFGVAVVEAFAAGMPVVSSCLEGSGLKVINPDGVTGFQFPVGDSEALALAVRRICEDRSLRDRMAANARNEYLEHYTPECYTRRFSSFCSKSTNPVPG